MKFFYCTAIVLFFGLGAVAQTADTTRKAPSAYGTVDGLSVSLKPTVVVDGKVFLGDINSLNVNDIKSITVVKTPDASKQYGAFNPNGVIKIETGRLYAINEPKLATTPKDTSANDTFAGLTGPLKPTIVVDDKVFLGNINSLDVNNIKSITVEKNPYASKQYGTFNANGVIKIETGKLYNTGKPAVPANPAKAASSGDPKYIIDGVLSESGLSNLSPEDILSVTILKDAKDHPEYGSSKNGFVIVVTKAGAIKKYQHNFSELSADYKKYLDEHKNDDSSLTYSVDGKLCDKGQDGLTKLSNLTKDKIEKVKFAKSGTDVEITTKK